MTGGVSTVSLWLLGMAAAVVLTVVLTVVVNALALRLLTRWLDTRFDAQARALSVTHQQVQQRLDGIEAAARQDAENWQRIERELLKFKAEMPTSYVRREDFVQSMGTIMSRLDAMALRFENMLLKQNK